MKDVPNEYTDPYWSDLADRTSKELGLPDNLLKNIVLKGERTNNDQVAPKTGARTPFQITEKSRGLAIKKYGIDPFLSPENAAKVSGLFIKESLQRNNGDERAAVREYIGGTKPDNWGPVTRAYVDRVLGPVAPRVDPDAPRMSTYDLIIGKQAASRTPSIAKVYDAYKAGKMTPEEASEFERDVNAGKVMLPKGAALTEKTQGPKMLPQGVTEAYVNGRMTPEERSDLERDIKAGLVQLPPSEMSQIEAINKGQQAPTNQEIIQQAPQPSVVDSIGSTLSNVGESILGAAEAGVSLATGATTGMVGGALGLAQGVENKLLNHGNQNLSQVVEGNMQNLTYAPRTAKGQEYLAGAGEFMNRYVTPIAPMVGELSLLGQTVKTGKIAAEPIVAQAADRALQAAKNTPNAVAQAAESVINAPARAVQKVGEMTGLRDKPESTMGTQGSVGAAGTDVAVMRQAKADELPVPIQYTKGQAERDYSQLRFEQETMKDPEIGAPLRERSVEQHKAARQNFEAFIDETGAQSIDNLGAGKTIDEALKAKAKRDKAEIRVAYNEARKSPEADNIVDPNTIVKIGSEEDGFSGTVADFLNSKPQGLNSTKLMDDARKFGIKLGVLEEVDGKVVGKSVSVKTMEDWRREINGATGFEPTDVRDATIIKNLIDGQVGPVAGPLYAKARSLRAKYAAEYENRSVIADLLNTKRGMSDRKVALEDITDRIINRGSADDLLTVRRTLQTAGEQGNQAWKEVQASAIRMIRDKALGNQRDISGEQMITPAGFNRAVTALDKDGKLNILFGKKGADQMRMLNEATTELFSMPPGTVNHSNTASVVAGMIDAMLSGSSGLPLPIATVAKTAIKQIKDNKLRARVARSLQKIEGNTAAKQTTNKGKSL